MTADERKDIIVLAADKNIEFAVRGIFQRTEALGIRHVEPDIFVNPEHDPGCLLRGHDFLRPFHKQYDRALVVFDKEGCGKEDVDRIDLESEVEDRLRNNGWDDRAAVVVIDPEVDAWVWSQSPIVDEKLGWKDTSRRLHDWLQEQFDFSPGGKPIRPKEALQATLREVGKPRSSSLYKELAESVSLTRCIDPAFNKLKTCLQNWFAE